MVTATIGIGQYGGGNEGNLATDGEIWNRAIVPTVVVVLGALVVGGLVVGGNVVGGLVVGGLVVGGLVVGGSVVGRAVAGGAFHATDTDVVVTALPVVVVVTGVTGTPGCWVPPDATTRVVPWPTRARAVTATNPSAVQVTAATVPSRFIPR